jgi:hypothetical protein
VAIVPTRVAPTWLNPETEVYPAGKYDNVSGPAVGIGHVSKTLSADSR